MNPLRRIALFGIVVALVVAAATAGIVIIQSRTTSLPVLINATIAGAVAGALALAASIWLRSVAGALMPLALFLTIGAAFPSQLPEPVFALTSICGTVLGVAARQFLSMSRVLVPTIASSALLLSLQKLFPDWHTRAAESLLVLTLSATLAALLARLSGYVERVVGDTLRAMRFIIRPSLAFIVAYASAAFLFSVAYGVCYYIDPRSLTYRGTSPDLLCLFQWSLTVFVTAGSAEFAPVSIWVRVLYVVQILVNVFITGFFLASFVVESRQPPSEEAR